MGKKFLKFLSPSGYRVKPCSESPSDLRPLTVQEDTPSSESEYPEQEEQADVTHSADDTHADELCNIAQDELSDAGYWKKVAEDPKLTWRQIEQRRGQKPFRQDLLRAYEGKCAVTGCDLEEALEAAHIERYADSRLDDVRNGLLLRADIHTLFDCYLITVNPGNYRIECAEKIRDGKHYWALAGQEVRRPKNPQARPSKIFLSRHYERFLKQDS